MAGSKGNRFWMRLAAIAGVAVSSIAAAAPAHAATIHVTAGAGDGVAADSTCSLREAVNAANDNDLSAASGCDHAGDPGSATDVIVVPAGTYDLSAGAGDDANLSGDLDLTGRVEIDGAGAAQTAISGTGDRVLDVRANAIVRVEGTTIKDGVTLSGASSASPGGNGASGEAGGGIRNASFLLLDDSVVTGNRAGAGGNAATGDPGGFGGEGGQGGGIESTGRLTLLHTTIDHNTAGDGGTGGESTSNGPSSEGGQGGKGGGVYAEGPVTLVDSVVAENVAGAGGRGGVEGPSFIDAGVGGPGGSGGGLFVGNGQLSVTDSVVRDNRAGAGGEAGQAPISPGNGGPGGFGGGIAAADSGSSVTVLRSTLSGNRAGTGGHGSDVAGGNVGGDGGEGGYGAALASTSAAVDVKASSLAANVAGAGGVGGDGKFRGGDGGDAGLSGGALLQGASASIADTTIADNAGGPGGESGDGEFGGTGGFGGSGGGVVALPGTFPGPLGKGGTLKITSSTFARNAAGDTHASKSSTSAGDLTNPPRDGAAAGALVVAGGDATVVNSTFSGNRAGRGSDLPSGANGTADPPAGDGGPGGAIFAAAPLTIRNSTLASNSVGAAGTGATNGSPGAGGAIVLFGDTTTLINTLVASNPGGNCSVMGGAFDDGGHDIDFPGSACPGADADPKLGPLQDNGGPTLTRAIGADGAAFDQVPSTGAGCPSVDQRGQGRPKGTACDIGAFELDPPAPGSGGQQGGQQDQPQQEQPPQGGNGGEGNPGFGNPGSAPSNQPAGGGGTTPVRLAIKLLLRGQRLRTALSKGYSARFDTNEASTGVLELFVEGSAARGLKPAARKRVRVARGSRKLTASGRGVVTAKFTRRARRALGRRRSVKVLVQLTVTDSAGAKSVTTQRVTLKR